MIKAHLLRHAPPAGQVDEGGAPEAHIPRGRDLGQDRQPAVASAAESTRAAAERAPVREVEAVTTSEPPLSAANGPRPPGLEAAIYDAVRLLCARITDGTYPPLATIPPVPTLAAALGVAPVALHHAVLYFKAAGLLADDSGATLVSENAPARITALTADRTLTSHAMDHPLNPGPSTQLADRIRADIAAGGGELAARQQAAAQVTQSRPPRMTDASLTAPPAPGHLTEVDRAVEMLCTRIADGTYPPLTVTAPLVDLAVQFGVPPAAISQAVRRLKKKGVLTSTRQGGATIAADAVAQLTQRAAVSHPPAATAPSIKQPIAELAARLRDEITEGVWPQGQFRTRRDLRVAYQVPHHVAAGALKLLSEEQFLETRRRVGARPLSAASRRPQACLSKELTLAGAVEAAIKIRIDEGTYPPGTRLQSTELAAEFNVSRSTVGKALHQLREKHVIEGRAQKTRVPQLPRTGHDLPPRAVKPPLPSTLPR
ncbi:GntR family transcriptional regulator [Streptomyces sp. TLI_146]|uniref:GntR family transcriptional regulator n=1 Tax=Streptomyces sp. TLI_146 TaxID=1938858 RepID=UPI000CC95F88|nr:GntR family transcriptional regulator [Streptomyces sp. TLI_146]PKV82695.1 DNA-binding GntR family transcriptional regulator [Streptomyces sp. TLI_146]